MSKKQIQKQNPRKSPDSNSSVGINKWLLIGGILFITFLCYSSSLDNAFTNWDDDHYVTDNPQLHKPIADCINYFFSNYYFNNYHPLTMIVYTMEYHLSELNPTIYHWMNLLLHLLNTALVFYFIFMLSGKKTNVAAIVALLFGIHPMHVESVAWVAELKDVLYTSFFLSGLIVYLYYLNEKKNIKMQLFLFTFTLFILSGLSKVAAITFPFALLTIDFYTRRKFTSKVWMEKIPFFIVSIIFGYLTFKAQEHNAIAPFEQYSIIERFALSSYAMIDYIVRLFLPFNLSALHPYPHNINGHLPTIYFITPFMALIIFGLVFYSLKSTRLIAFGFLFFIGNIFLVLQFLSVGLAITSERYSYVPYIGLFFIIAMGFNNIYHTKNLKLIPYKSLSSILLIVFLLMFSYLTYARCEVWKNNEVMWTDVIEKYPNDHLAYDNRGVYYRSIKRNDLALLDYNKVVQINPKYALGFNNRGNIYFDSNQDDLALADYNQSLKLDSTTANIFTNRALIYARKKEYDKAEKDFEKALKINPEYKEAYMNRGIYWDMVNQNDKAYADFTKYLSIKPKDDGIYNSRGVTLQKLSKFKESIDDFTKAIELNPNVSAYWYNRCLSEGKLGEKDKAEKDAMQAQKLGFKVDFNFLKSYGIVN